MAIARQEPARLRVRSLNEYLDAAVAEHPEVCALDFLGKRYSYRELARLVDRAARGLQNLGIVPGDRVGLCLPNTPYFVICYYAILKIGGIVVNYNPLYVERELEHQIEDSGTRMMITIDLKSIYPKVAHMLDTTGLERVVVCPMNGILPAVKGMLFSLFKRDEIERQSSDERHTGFFELIDDEDAPAPVAIDPYEDLAVLQYTGGTTGVPKGAMLTHANLSANVEQMGYLMPDLETGRERLLVVLPLFHVFAMTVAMNFGIRLASTLILVPRFDLEQVLKLIEKHRPTFFAGVPTLYTALNAAMDTKLRDFSGFRFCISGGAPLPVEVRQRFERLAGCPLLEGYGLSETSPVVTFNPLNGGARDGSIGQVVTGTKVEIRDPADPARTLQAGEKGELCVRGPQVMLGYWRREQETRDVLVDGVLRTGDIGYCDEDGFYFLVDRIKDVILCGGYNVYPRIIEEALYEHPAIAEAAVIGIPDEYRGQAPKAFIRLRDGMQATPEEIKTFLAERISKIEMPESIVMRAELPKTMVGKLSKKMLQAEEQHGGA